MRTLLHIVLILGVALLGCISWFLAAIPEDRPPVGVTTQAIVVLTGGTGRVEQGLRLLADGAAPVLFISGVGKHTSRAQLLDLHATPEIAKSIRARDGEIVLDYAANSTLSNAEQTAHFVQARGLRNLRLVTAHYHMPRSLLEFRAAMPEVEILPDPVIPYPFKTRHWWQDVAARRLFFSECKKYFVVLLLQKGHVPRTV